MLQFKRRLLNYHQSTSLCILIHILILKIPILITKQHIGKVYIHVCKQNEK